MSSSPQQLLGTRNTFYYSTQEPVDHAVAANSTKAWRLGMVAICVVLVLGICFGVDSNPIEQTNLVNVAVGVGVPGTAVVAGGQQARAQNGQPQRGIPMPLQSFKSSRIGNVPKATAGTSDPNPLNTNTNTALEADVINLQSEKATPIGTQKGWTSFAAYLALPAVVLAALGAFLRHKRAQHLAVPDMTGIVSTAQTKKPKVTFKSGGIDARSSFAMMSISGRRVAHAKSNVLLDSGEEYDFGIRPPVLKGRCDMTGITLSRWIMEVARANPELEELEDVINSIQVAAKKISSLVRRTSIRKAIKEETAQENQANLEVITNDVMSKALQFSGRIGVLSSEETQTLDVQTDFDDDYTKNAIVEESGQYVAIVNALEGSEQVDAGVPCGTIFGVFEEDDSCLLLDEDDSLSSETARCLAQMLQPGTNLVAAGYVLYSSCTQFVLTVGNGVQGFTLDENMGEFILTDACMRIPDRGQIYSLNTANRMEWDKPMQEYIETLREGNNATGRRYTQRYTGSLVADFHRIMRYGGIFGYPADKGNPDGSLRLLYEAAPLSFLMEQANGRASTGSTRIMDLIPRLPEQRVPCIMGSSEDLEEMTSYYEKCNDPAIKARCEARRLAGGAKKK